MIESTLRVYIVEDSPLFLQAIQNVLNENECVASTVEPAFRRVSLKPRAVFVFEKSRDFAEWGVPVVPDTSAEAARTWY